VEDEVVGGRRKIPSIVEGAIEGNGWDEDGRGGEKVVTGRKALSMGRANRSAKHLPLQQSGVWACGCISWGISLSGVFPRCRYSEDVVLSPWQNSLVDIIAHPHSRPLLSCPCGPSSSGYSPAERLALTHQHVPNPRGNENIRIVRNEVAGKG
jgi:hypothetical protein